MEISSPQLVRAPSESSQPNYRFALVTLTSLFFIWGFITSLNDILIPHLKNVFSLTFTQAMLIQFCFFGAYFIVSWPAGVLVSRIGYKRGIVVGLVIAALGCLMFYPAASLQVYNIFLAALFVLASGITILQVSANPYVAALGSEKTSSSRLTLTQAFNSLGTTVAPWFGTLLILGAAAASVENMSAAEFKAHEAELVQFPYLLLMAALLVLAGIMAILKLPEISSHHTPESEQTQSISRSAWSYPHLVLGAVGIFVYVGAEVSIGSFLVSFLGEPEIADMPESMAGHYIAYYWGGAMVGRFIGAAAMSRLAAGKVLAFNALCSIILVIVAMNFSGQLAMWAILAVGLFNSIMFPTIFTLALKQLKECTAQGSGILCLAIVGGAILPLGQGMLADSIGLQESFILPALCYLFIAYYGIWGSRIKS